MPRKLRPIHLTSDPPTYSFEEASRAFAKVTELLLRADARRKQREAAAEGDQADEHVHKS